MTFDRKLAQLKKELAETNPKNTKEIADLNLRISKIKEAIKEGNGRQDIPMLFNWRNSVV